MHTQHAGPATLVTVDLSREDHDSFYAGYSNGVLWPVFHYRLDLADFDAGYISGYRRVNQMFARKLKPLLRDDDIIWVHDYHLIPFAAELRALGCQQRIGFFLHIPLPPSLILAAIPSRSVALASLALLAGGAALSMTALSTGLGVTLDLKPAKTTHPFARGMFRRLRCPAAITAGASIRFLA